MDDERMTPPKESPAMDKPAEGLFEKLMEMVPKRPESITWEHGCAILDYVQDVICPAIPEMLSIVKPLREKAEAAKLVIATAEQLRLEAEKGRDFYIRSFETERDERRESNKDRDAWKEKAANLDFRLMEMKELANHYLDEHVESREDADRLAAALVRAEEWIHRDETAHGRNFGVGNEAREALSAHLALKGKT